MNRRTFVAGSLSLLVAPRTGAAQPASRVYRIGWLSGYSVDEPFRQELRSLGYVEGRNLVLEARFTQGKIERYPALAAELVALRVDVIVCPTTVATRAAREATQTIPIVMSGAANPMAEGLIASLARPGGNVTGAILQTADVTAKRIELLKEALPRVRRVAALHQAELRSFPIVDQWLRDSEAAAQRLGLQLEPVDLPFDPARWESVLDSVTRRGISAAVIMEGGVYHEGRIRLAELALKYRLAVMFPFPEQAEAGGLMSYGADTAEVQRRAAGIVDRILRGAHPADLPVEQPTRFPFIVNLKTATALGITLPPTVLARASQLIQ